MTKVPLSKVYEPLPTWVKVGVYVFMRLCDTARP